MRTVDKKGKKAACELINEMCGVEVRSLSRADDQCECLLGAITVCIISDSICVFSSYFFPVVIVLERR